MTRSTSVARIILLARLLFLVIMAGAVVCAVILARRRGAVPPGSTDVYSCPMHAAISSPVAGECPICRMPLTARRHVAVEALQAADLATVSLSTEAIRVSGVQVTNPKRLTVPRATVVPASLTADDVGTALLYREDLDLLEVEERAVFVPGEVPIRLLRDSAAAWDPATVTVRFEPLDHARPGSARRTTTGWVTLAPRNRDALLVPTGAVLTSASGPFVLVVVDERDTSQTFARRAVEVGRVVFGHTSMRGGVDERDRVVVAGAFFIDAERRLADPLMPARRAAP